MSPPPVSYAAVRSETTTQTFFFLPAAVSMFAKARVAMSATVPWPTGCVARIWKYGGISSRRIRIGWSPSNSFSQSLSSGALGPAVQNPLNCSALPSWLAISPQK